jgi:hypothetical protein
MHTQRNGLRLAAALGGFLLTLAAATPGLAVDILDDPQQVDERAAQIVQTSNSLCWEMHRYHRQQPDYPQAYRTAKDIWSRAGELRDALRAGPVETEVLMQQVAQMNDSFKRLEQSLSKWGDGDRSSVPMNGGPGTRTIVTPGVSVDLPFIGVVGSPRVAVIDDDDGPPALMRRRMHPNSHGSKRSLERELAAVKVAVSYLVEDAGVSGQPLPPAPGTASPAGPVPNPPDAGDTGPASPGPASPALGDPIKIGPKSAKKPAAGATQK